VHRLIALGAVTGCGVLNNSAVAVWRLTKRIAARIMAD
jgi:hypothetical protein